MAIQDTLKAIQEAIHTAWKKELFDPSLDTSPLWSNSQSPHHTSWMFWIIWVVVVGIWWFVYSIFDRVLLVFTWIVIAIAIESLITYFETRTWKRRFALILSYLILIGLLLSGVLVMIPFIVNQVGDLIGTLLQYAQHLETSLKTNTLEQLITHNTLYHYLKSWWLDIAQPEYLTTIQSFLQNNISAIVSSMSSYAKDAGTIVVSTVWWIISTLVQIGFVLTLSVLLSIEKTHFVRFIYRVSWNSPVAHKKITLLYEKLWFWLKTQILLWLYIGITMYVSLWIIHLLWVHITNKWSLATISALTELIPYIGPTLWWIPVIIMGAVAKWRWGVLVAGITVFCVQRIENNILIPLLFKRQLGISPVVIFLCMVLWWMTVGINGVILAIPIAVIITILYENVEE